jgi:hypothetical protein
MWAEGKLKPRRERKLKIIHVGLLMKESTKGDYGRKYASHKSSAKQVIILTRGFPKYSQDNAVILEKKS